MRIPVIMCHGISDQGDYPLSEEHFNTLVQIEEDFYRTEDGGTRAVKSLVVVEYRDGKRWREWRFKPQDR